MSNSTHPARLAGGIVSGDNFNGIDDESVDVEATLVAGRQILVQQEAEHVLALLLSNLIDRPISRYAEEAYRLIGVLQDADWESHVPALVELERSIFRNLHLQSTAVDDMVS